MSKGVAKVFQAGRAGRLGVSKQVLLSRLFEQRPHSPAVVSRHRKLGSKAHLKSGRRE
jgi:hypothetical protein